MDTIIEKSPIIMDNKMYSLAFNSKPVVEINRMFRLNLEAGVEFKCIGIYSIENVSYDIQVSSIARQNLNGLKLRASVVITNNDTYNHLHDYKWVFYGIFVISTIYEIALPLHK